MAGSSTRGDQGLAVAGAVPGAVGAGLLGAGVGGGALAVGASVGERVGVAVGDEVGLLVGKGIGVGKGVAVRAVGVVTGDLVDVCGVVAPGLGPRGTVVELVPVLTLGGGVETME